MTVQTEKKLKENQEKPLAKIEKKDKQKKTTAVIDGKDPLFLNFDFTKEFKIDIEKRKSEIKEILLKYAKEEKRAEKDLEKVLKFSLEIEGISVQNRILHGERLLEVKEILKGGESKDFGYKDGCFIAWIMKVYGNKQTPYNYINYTSLYKKLPNETREKFLSMPFTAASNLAPKGGLSTQDTIEVEPGVLDIIKNSEGKSRDALMFEIRERFKGTKKGKKPNKAGTLISLLKRVEILLKNEYVKLNNSQRVEFEDCLEELKKFRDESL